MPKLVGGTHYLVLCRDGLSHRVFFDAKFESALAHWEPGSRISPIFSLDNSEIPTLEGRKKHWIVFTGPVYPGVLEGESFPAFLSLGTYNLVLVGRTAADRKRVHQFLKRVGTHWEEWELVGNVLGAVVLDEVVRPEPPIPQAQLAVIPNQPEQLQPALREYRTLMATTVGRAAIHVPAQADELVRFDTGLRAVLANAKVPSLLRQTMLVNANAALSRYSSQAFSGISPITQTECHFWTHSLLGIGTASHAIGRLKTSVERVFVDQRLVSRVRALSHVPPHKADLLALSGTDDFWDAEHLFSGTVDSQLSQDSNVDPDLPLLTFYSGRDGFRSTKISLSAPLEVITSCNTTAWTPLTLTHEISHTIIEGVLGAVLPQPSDREGIRRTVLLLANKEQPRSLLEQLLVMLAFSVLSLGSTSTEKHVSEDAFATAMRHRLSELNEILTHVFDFLYFYQKDDAKYVESVWASWGVIPNIQSRVHSYLIRTLCALHANYIRAPSGADLTLDQLSERLKATHQSHPSDLTAAAIDELKANRQQLSRELKERARLVKFVRSFLYQPRIVAALWVESNVVGGDHEGYALKVNDFHELRISNPLKFVSAFSRDSSAQPARAAWLLAHLAFGVAP